jgi:signal transduction histidine kinase
MKLRWQIFWHTFVWLLLVCFFMCIALNSNTKWSVGDLLVMFVLYPIINISLFYLNSLVLIPLFLVKKKYGIYAIAIAITIILYGFGKYRVALIFKQYILMRPGTQVVGFGSYFLSTVFTSLVFLFLSAVLKFTVDWFLNERIQRDLEYQRLRSELAFLKIRTDIAADFHDELGSTLSSIALYSEMAISDSTADERTKSILSLIGESSRGTVSAMQDMIWTLQPKNDSMQEVVYRMREYAYPLAELKNISLTFEAGEDVQNLVLSMDTRKNIYLIFKEALNNAFKYAAASHIIISLTKQNNLLSLQIKDDGKGFDLTNAIAGNGLTNMHKRAGQAGGTLTIKSGEGCGTEILFSSTVA